MNKTQISCCMDQTTAESEVRGQRAAESMAVYLRLMIRRAETRAAGSRTLLRRDSRPCLLCFKVDLSCGAPTCHVVLLRQRFYGISMIRVQYDRMALTESNTERRQVQTNKRSLLAGRCCEKSLEVTDLCIDPQTWPHHSHNYSRTHAARYSRHGAVAHRAAYQTTS